MQFIPSTWSVVGVDGDGDGKRDPQDIDDAALATAVYLCSGDEDLSSAPARSPRSSATTTATTTSTCAVDHGDAYASGDYSAVPTNSTGTTTFTPSYGDSVFSGGTNGYQPPEEHRPRRRRLQRRRHDDGLGRRHHAAAETDDAGGSGPDRRSPLRPRRRSPTPSETVEDTVDKVDQHRQGHHQATSRTPSDDTLDRGRGEGPVPRRGRADAGNLANCIEGLIGDPQVTLNARSSAAQLRCSPGGLRAFPGRQSPRRSAAQERGGLGGPVGQHHVGAGAADAGQRLEDRRPRGRSSRGRRRPRPWRTRRRCCTPPPARRRRRGPRGARRGRPAPASPSRCRRPRSTSSSASRTPSSRLRPSCW